MKTKEVKQISPLIKEYFDMLQKGELKGIPTGFDALDKIISGWQNSELIIIGARPGMGKTAFIISMIKNMAVDYNIPVAIFSLEMSNEMLVNRFITNVSEVDNTAMKNGKLTKQEWNKINGTIESLTNAPIYIDNSSKLSVQELCNSARKLVSENNVKVIFIDYIQLLTVTDKYSDNRYNELNFISRELKSLAKELNIPIIATSQLNRNMMDRQGADGKRPQLTDLRDSGTLCDDADIICFIHRPEYYRITEDEQGYSLIGIGEIIIAKNRNGCTGELKLRFRNEICKFQTLEKIKIENTFISSKLNEDFENPVPF